MKGLNGSRMNTIAKEIQMSKDIAQLKTQLVQKHWSRSPGPVPEIDATSRARSVSDCTKETANVKLRHEG